MKILAVAAAFESQKFVGGYPPKGARLFLQPDIEICRLASLTNEDEFVYQDERVEIIGQGDFQLVLVRIQFNQEESARPLVERFTEIGIPVLVFGPQVTAWDDTEVPGWVKHMVRGDITLVWDRILQDCKSGKLQPLYSAPQEPHYVVPRFIFPQPLLMNNHYQAVQFVRGCACPLEFKKLCPEFLYYGERTAFRSRDEIVGEVVSLPGKYIHLLDDDVACAPDYYYKLFAHLWRYRRHWRVNAGEHLFDYPALIRLLSKAGVKIIFLNETFLNSRLEQALTSEAMVKYLYRRVKFLQSRRMLVGARLVLPATGVDFRQIANVLTRIDLDFIEPRFVAIDHEGQPRLVPVCYHPMVQSDEPGWLMSRFYAFDLLVDRFVRRPRRVGFHSTLWYLIPYSLAYRQNFLEGIPI
uniref:Uncharacterized protein n=1 Tax=candidate division WOR-3 bacterium TaxID=2052148 RepID=A0A7V3PSR5_UNCW3